MFGIVKMLHLLFMKTVLMCFAGIVCPAVYEKNVKPILINADNILLSFSLLLHICCGLLLSIVFVLSISKNIYEDCIESSVIFVPLWHFESSVIFGSYLVLTAVI
jgi:hypothetical protein